MRTRDVIIGIPKTSYNIRITHVRYTDEQSTKRQVLYTGHSNIQDRLQNSQATETLLISFQLFLPYITDYKKETAGNIKSPPLSLCTVHLPRFLLISKSVPQSLIVAKFRPDCVDNLWAQESVCTVEIVIIDQRHEIYALFRKKA
ncbi:hypothetical protein DPMN_001379 [Dreissena polymorpha]|uniref:Uncharacterized protein n=1 Tax=Dreissena polymorpha TaxID=45954 RepID=A0A9D4MJQ7_DREPO|nr:hypothetical protein DPMN_001379 [Dreissena polymorpha]